MSFPTQAVPRRGTRDVCLSGEGFAPRALKSTQLYQTASPGNFQAARKGLHGDYLGRWCGFGSTPSRGGHHHPLQRLSDRPSARPSDGAMGPGAGGGAGPGRRWGGRREGEKERRREGEEGGKEGQRLAGPAAHTDRPSPGAAAAGTRRRQPAPGRTGQVGTGGLRDGGVRRGAEGSCGDHRCPPRPCGAAGSGSVRISPRATEIFGGPARGGAPGLGLSLLSPEPTLRGRRQREAHPRPPASGALV